MIEDEPWYSVSVLSVGTLLVKRLAKQYYR